MIGRSEHVAGKPISVREGIVSGLLGGLLAGLAMMITLILLGLLRGEQPGIQMARFASAGEPVSPWMGLLSHEGVSVVYGMLFGLLAVPLMRRFPERLAAGFMGIAYGLALFALAELAILPGTASPLREIPAVIFGAGHLVYGLLLGLFLHGQKGL